MTPEAVIARTFNLREDDIEDASSSETIPDWDSLGHITVIVELENAFGVSFSPDEAVNMTSVEKIKAALQSRGLTW